MKNRLHWIAHRGQRILVNDYTDLRGEPLVEQILIFRRKIQEMKESDILVLVRTDTAVTVHKAALTEFTASAKMFRGRFKRTAILGASPMQRLILNTVNRVSDVGARAFETEKEALDWLIDG